MACKSDDSKKDKEQQPGEEVEVVSQSEKHLQNIFRAHNGSKFKSEDYVRFQLKFKFKDDAFFEGFMTIKTNGSKIRFLDSNTDKIIESANLQTELDQQLFWLAELYSMGFWLDQDDFETLKNTNEDYVKAVYSSKYSSSVYKVYTHPLTAIIQHVDYTTHIPGDPFNSGTVFYEKYITVNRIPVPLRWTFIKQKDTIAKAEITRISYPDQF